MSDNDRDVVEFTMIDGEKFRMSVVAGKGRGFMHESYEGGWIAIDENTRIRTDKVVSMKLIAAQAEDSRIL